MNHISIDPLYRFLHTHRDANDMIGLITGIHSHIFDTEVLPEEIVLKNAPYEIAEAIFDVAKKNEFNLKNKDQADHFFKILVETFSSIPIVSLNLAKPPKINLLEQIKAWCKINLKSHVLLDITVDPNLLAGTQIYFNGKYKDYSLRMQLTTK